ncbi:hypothetical protein GFV16_25705 [Bacillus megaterium]|uniref:CBO0543 family protein n=1 Tax=Priestia megaterium TaxID=1404 RepID=UPI001294081C|nr:CBO0543 family protein [Priestia megaterium]MQR89257.1 hypothetical protein [Priestia megaterium]
MRNKKFEVKFLRVMLVIALGILPFLFRKPPIKDWLLAYVFNALTNGIIDKFIVTHGLLRYPTRLMKKQFRINVLFDFLLYPMISVMINQATYYDKGLKVLYKIMFFTIPMFFIELWAEKRTKLIEWKTGWMWYHTFTSVTLKSYLNRMLIGWIRKIEKKQEETKIQ